MKHTPLRRRFINHENWINSNCEGPLPKNGITEYEILFQQNPNAYDYFRHKLEFHFGGKDSTLRVELFKMMNDIKNSDSPAYEKIMEYFTSFDSFDRFQTSRDNSFNFSRAIKSNELNNLIALFYQMLFEIDIVHEFLLTTGKFVKQGVLDLNHTKEKDRNGEIKKGATIELIASCFKNYPTIKKFVKQGYIPKLRNSIGHNSYKLKENKLISQKMNISFSREEIGKSLFAIQEIQNSIANYLAICTTNKEFKEGTGSIGCIYALNEEEKPILLINVLWCFFDKDIFSKLIDNIDIQIEGNILHTYVNELVNFKGEKPTKFTKNIFSIIESEGIEISFLSLKPNFDEDSKETKTALRINDIEYEVVDRVAKKRTIKAHAG